MGLPTAPSPFNDLVGFLLVDTDNNVVSYEFRPTPRAYNRAGIVHGGLFGALCDSAMGTAISRTLDASERFVTVEYHVHLLHSATEQTGTLSCTAWVVQRGRTIAVTEAEVRDAAGRRYATATGTALIRGDRP